MRTTQRLILPLLAAVASCRHPGDGNAPPAAMPPIPVTVTTVAPRDLPYTFEYLGLSRGSREVEIRARISGFLEARHFVEGRDVAAGDLLFELDGKALQAQVATARADLATATAHVEQTRREAARLRPLVATEAASAREADDADSAASIAAAELDAAKARLEQMQVDLSYTRITAPIAGRVGQALREQGSLVGPTADGVLTRLVQLDPIYVMFQRTDRQQVRLDDDVKSGRLVLPPGGFTVDALHRDGTVLVSGGHIDFSGSEFETDTGTIPMRATIANPEHHLLAGQAVKVVLRGAVLKGAIAVPQRAVQEGAVGKIVYVATAKGGGLVAEARPITAGEWIDLPGEVADARQWIVTAGLAAGDRVIVDNLMMMAMAPGAPITIAPAAPIAPTAPQQGK